MALWNEMVVLFCVSNLSSTCSKTRLHANVLPFSICVLLLQAAARHQCSYLINMHVDEFLKTGGIAEWLNGLEYIPQRLKNLNEINKLLAHRPWLITKEHIQVPEKSCL